MIGIDIVLLSRFKRIATLPHGYRFLRMVFSDFEINTGASIKAPLQYESLAARFAIKEAVIKASGGEMTLDDILSIETSGNPWSGLSVHIIGQNWNGRNYAVSICQTSEYAIGIAMRKD
jgi:phosphopantetheine--protein transferase-like protein